MKLANWHIKFFQYYYRQYFHESLLSPGRVRQEVRFIREILRLPRWARILDVGAGPGRHALELGRWYNVTALDFNSAFLNEIHESTKRRHVRVKTVRADMRRIPFQDTFDAVISLYTSFGYFPDEKDNIRTLSSMVRSLRPRGNILIDLPNRHWLRSHLPSIVRRWTPDGTLIIERRRWTPNAKSLVNDITIQSRHGTQRSVRTFLRTYHLTDIRRILYSFGCKLVAQYGSFSKSDRFNPRSSKRLIIVGQKRSE